MLKLSSSRGIRIDIPVLSVSWSFEDHSVIIKALREGLIEHEASDTGGVPRWQSSCPDRLAEATERYLVVGFGLWKFLLGFEYCTNWFKHETPNFASHKCHMQSNSNVIYSVSC